jgi:hypothetical protein
MRASSEKTCRWFVGAILPLFFITTAQAAEPLVLARESLSFARSPGEIVIELDQQAHQRIVDSGHGTVRDFPLPGKAPVDLELMAFNLLAPRARFVVVDESGERELPPPPVRAFRGKVKGDPDSLVSLTFLGDRLAGFIKTWDNEYSVGPEDYNRARPGSHRIRVRERSDPPGGEPAFECGGALVPGPETHADPSGGTLTSQSSSSGASSLSFLPQSALASATTDIDGSTLLQATIAIDATVEFYEHFGSLTATQDYILNLMAQISTIYESDVLIKIDVGYLRVFTAEPDPYTDGSTDTSVLLADLRAEWTANQSGVDRTVTHLFSRRSSGGSGLAYVDVLCSKSYGYGVSTFPGSGGSWEKDLTAHEIGHNFSSPHTHCFIPEIDLCANEQGCYQGTTQQSLGTIMSYCGQKQSTFHQRVRNERIRPAAEDAYPACVTTAGLPGDVGDGSGNGLQLSKPALCPSAALRNDDGSLNGYYGYYGTTRMAWIKRFAPSCYPFRLTTLEVMIGHTSSISPGRPIRLLVYVDPSGSGDPGYATLVHSQDTTVQVVSAATWNSYELSDAVMIGSGDYYIGVYDLEADEQNSYIASRDTSREGDSWQAANSTSPDDFGAHAGATWMIRGDGGAVPHGTIKLEWQLSCNEATTPDQDYAVYGGTIGSFHSLDSLTCSTSRATSWLASGVEDGSFLIVVPQTSANEGSYGRDGDGLERAPAATACHPQEAGSCP